MAQIPRRGFVWHELMTTDTDGAQNYHYLNITEVSELIRQKKVSPAELVTGCLKRIEQLNPMLNAFITVRNIQLTENRD